MKTETERGLSPLRETVGRLAIAYKLALAGALFAGAVTIGSSGASAVVIDLTPPDNVPFFGPSYLQNIVFNNAPAIIQFNGDGTSFGNWIAAGLPQNNADSSNADIFLTTPQLVSMFVGPPLGGVIPPPGGGNIAAPVNFNFNCQRNQRPHRRGCSVYFLTRNELSHRFHKWYR
jgi:hypothetical protein